MVLDLLIPYLFSLEEKRVEKKMKRRLKAEVGINHYINLLDSLVYKDASLIEDKENYIKFLRDEYPKNGDLPNDSELFSGEHFTKLMNSGRISKDNLNILEDSIRYFLYLD